MPSTIYLHIGTEKTGTTSIQRYCKNNRKILLDSGLLYPSTVAGRDLVGHFALAASTLKLVEPARVIDFMSGEVAGFDAEWANILRQVKDSPSSDVLISCEHFSSRMRERHITAIKSKLDECFPNYDVKIVVALRRQDKLFESAFSTSIKSGSKKTVSDFFEEAMRKTHYFDFLSMLNAWSEIFGAEAILVNTFDELSCDGALISTFLKIMGVNLKVNESDYRDNQSLSSVASLCGRIVNVECDSSRVQALKKINDLLRDEREFVLTQRESAAIVQAFYEDNRVIAEKYLKRPFLFSEDAYVWSKDYRYVTEDNAKNRLIMALLKEVMNCP